MASRPSIRYVRVCLWAFRLPARPGAGDDSATFAPVDPTEVAGLAVAMALPVDLVIARQNRSRCYAGRVGDDIASYGWVSEAETALGEIEAIIRPGDGEAYIWDCRTLPAFRGRGLYRDLLTQLVTDLSRDRLHRAWIATLQRNRAGCRGVMRAGFHPVLRIRHLRLGPMRWWWVKPDRAASDEDVQAARRAVRLGQSLERPAATRPSATPPAPVGNR